MQNLAVAYLVNQYPKTSHSFIRREILALEALGIRVERFSIRSTENGGFVDPSDAAEADKTTVLLKDAKRLAASVIQTALRHPIRFADALQKTVRYAARSDRSLVSHAAYLVEACTLLQDLREARVNHVHAHFGTNSALVAHLTHLLGHVEFSFTVHGPEEFDRASVLQLRPAIESSKFVAAISDFGRSQLCRLVDHDYWSKISVVRCGLDAALLGHSVAPIPDEPRLVCVGRLSEQKGHLALLEAAAELSRLNQPFHLVLAGDGPLRPVLEERIRQLGLQQCVTITGWLTEQQVLAQLEAARALVLPSFAEGLPVVIMEAMALGRPVISTFVAGIPELVRPGENGWLIPAGAVPQLVDAMRSVLQMDRAILAAMGQRGQAAVRAQHNVDDSARRLQELFGHDKTRTA